MAEVTPTSAAPAAPAVAAPAAPITTSATTAPAPVAEVVADPKAPEVSAKTLLSADAEAKPETDKAADTKPEDEAEPVTPNAEIEVKLPEGVAPDAVLMDKFKPLAKELGLKNDGAQKLVNLAIEMQSRAYETAQKAIEDAHKSWVSAIKADKDIGGAKLKENLEVAKQAIARFGGKALDKVLTETGLGNHPELVRAFVKIGRAIKDDSSAGKVGNGASNTAVDPVKQRYPNTPQFHNR